MARRRLISGGIVALAVLVIAAVALVEATGKPASHAGAGHPGPVLTIGSPTPAAVSAVVASPTPTVTANSAPPASLAAPAPAAPVPAPPAVTIAPSSTIAYVNGPATIQIYGDHSLSQPLKVFPGHNVIGQPEVFLVINAATPGWFQVLLPSAPNGTTGWVPTSAVQTANTTDFLLVSLSRFALYHYNDGKLVASMRVAIGKPETPTPLGIFYIWASQGVSSAPYDPGIFALNGFTTKPVPGFLGASLGVHGWTDPSVIGTQASNGCVRVGTANMSPLIQNLILGTPVEIVA